MPNTRFISSIKRRVCDEVLDVILICSFPGIRMQSYGNKGLMRITSNHTLLEYQVEQIHDALPHSNIIIVTGFESTKIDRFRSEKTRLVEHRSYERLNESEAIRLGLNNVTANKALIIHGDMFFDRFFLKNINYNVPCLVYDCDNPSLKKDIGINVVGDNATLLSYDSENKWTHTILLLEDQIKYLITELSMEDKKRLFDFETVNLMLNKFTFKAIQRTHGKTHRVNVKKDIDIIAQNLAVSNRNKYEDFVTK